MLFSQVKKPTTITNIPPPDELTVIVGKNLLKTKDKTQTRYAPVCALSVTPDGRSVWAQYGNFGLVSTHACAVAHIAEHCCVCI